MAVTGGYYLYKFNSLGTVQNFNEDGILVNSDNSFRILLYGILTIFFIVAFVYTWILNIKQAKISEQLVLEKKKLKTAKDDLRALVDQDFHKTLLALPVLGIIVFNYRIQQLYPWLNVDLRKGHKNLKKYP